MILFGKSLEKSLKIAQFCAVCVQIVNLSRVSVEGNRKSGVASGENSGEFFIKKNAIPSKFPGFFLGRSVFLCFGRICGSFSCGFCV